MSGKGPVDGSEQDIDVQLGPQESADFGSYARVFRYADAKGWLMYGVAFLCAIAAGTLLPLMNIVFGQFVNEFNAFAMDGADPTAFKRVLRKLTLWFVYLFIAKFVLVYTWTLGTSIGAIRITKALRIHFLEQTLRQDITFFDSPETGATSVQISTNGTVVNQGIGEKLGLLIQGCSTFVSAFIVALVIQWKLTLITIAIVPFILIVTSICIAIDIKNEGEIQPMFGRAAQLAEEAFGTIANVHAYWAQPKISARYETYLRAARKKARIKSPNYGALFSVEFFCVFSGYALAFWQGIRMYVSGEIEDAGTVVTVIFAVVLAATSLTSIAPQTIQISKAAGAASELFKIIDRQPEIDSFDKSGIVPESMVGNIEFKDVQFSYPSRKNVQVFSDFSLNIPANQTTALVGPSGSGKSTTVALLERWYAPSGGEILVDGVPIETINISWLRSNVRLVQQEPVLFNGTIFENVAFGLASSKWSEVSEEEKRTRVEEACEAAFAHEFIEQLPQGYDTPIGQKGSRLSGGQKQRLAIARCIISDPKILLLDEATSALDPRAEKIVQKALDNVSKNRTTIVIAHRLSTIRNADNIVVLKKGRVVETGTHAKLLDQRGIYHQLVKAQDLGQEDSDEVTDPRAYEDDAMLVRTNTRHSVPGTSGGEESPEELETVGYPLIKCLWILAGENFSKLKWVYLVTLIASVMGGLVFPAMAIVFSRVVNVFQQERSEMQKDGNFYALMFFMIAIANLVAYFSIGWTSNIICQWAVYRYRLEMVNHVLRQDKAFFDEPNNSPGALVTKVNNAANSLLELLGFNITLIIIGIVNVVSSSILAIIVGWRLGLAIVFGALPVVIVCGYLQVRIQFKLDDQVGQRFADSASLASEAVLAIRTVASLQLERNVVDRFRERVRYIEKHSIKSLLFSMFWFALTQSINFLAMALGFWYGGTLLAKGEYSTTQFFIVFVAVIFSGESAAQFFSYTTSITKGATAANFLFWLRRSSPSIAEKSNTASEKEDENDSDASASVACHDLEFAYPQRLSTKVLRGIDIKAGSGHTIAFVGASGCGKSTMIAMLERFYDPSAGSVSYNDRNIKDMCPRKYRSNISLVEQEPTLYRMSIRDNVALGLESEATDAQVEQACRAANIHDFIASLPEGYATLCGSKGSQLSGGEKQRVAIARALVRDPKLLLLDEATSALDTESERVVQEALKEAAARRTTVCVAHRLSTIKESDWIYVFAKGKIVEEGSHGELLEKRGVYYDMCLGQKLDKAV